MNPFDSNLQGQGVSHDPINLDEVEHTTSSYSGHNEAESMKKRKQSQVAEIMLISRRSKQGFLRVN